MTKETVFLSYPRSDEAWAHEFAKSLSDRGVGVWLDQPVRAGDFWRDAVEKGLREAEVMIFLVTPNTLNSPILFFEIGAAISMGKRVVPVVSSDVDPSTLPQSLRLRKYLIMESPEATAEEFATGTVEPSQLG